MPTKNQHLAILIYNYYILGINSDLTYTSILLIVSERITNALYREPM
jgi:hypothetical protein